MKLLLLLVFISVSQHALAVVVEVYKGEKSVLLPCLYSGFTPEDSTVMWTRHDLNPKSVHLRGGGGDDLRGQNQRYSGRTSLNIYDLNARGTKDFSLTLKTPEMTDSGSYTCSISAGRREQRVRDIQLQVKESFPPWAKFLVVLVVLVVLLVFLVPDRQVNVDSGVEFVQLPCKATKILPEILPEDTRVEWKDRYNNKVYVYDQPESQSQIYRDRTEMKRNVLKTRDFGLILKYPADWDRGTYTCTVYRRDGHVLMTKQVELNVRVHQVEVDSGVESVQLPCKAKGHLPEDAKVEWTDGSISNKKVHVYQSGSDWPEEHHQVYRDRTELNEDPLRTGDLSLTLKRPTDGDTKIYTCTIYSREGNILLRKQVELKVRVHQVEVDSGMESVQLPCKTMVYLPKDAKVEWTDKQHRKVHVFQSGSDRPEEQELIYSDRTTMNGDLSLTLRYPTNWDTNTYTCTVYSRFITRLEKQVELNVRVRQVEVMPGVGFAQLLFQTTENLPEHARVEWKDRYNNKVYVYENGSDRPGEQDQVYRGRTEMNKDLLRTGDLSLTLKHPTERDSGTYRCCIWSKRDILRLTTVTLTVFPVPLY